MKPAFIMDMDGTAALHVNPDGSLRRKHYDYTKVSEDLPNSPVLRLAERLSSDMQLIVVSGREDSGNVRKDTVEWLSQHSSLVNYPLFMRRAGDFRKDDLIKDEIYTRVISDRYIVHYAIDDRPRVLRMWQSKGITTLAVGTPWIEF